MRTTTPALYAGDPDLNYVSQTSLLSCMKWAGSICPNLAPPLFLLTPCLAASKEKLENMGVNGLTEPFTGALNQMNQDDGLVNEAKVLSMATYGEIWISSP